MGGKLAKAENALLSSGAQWYAQRRGKPAAAFTTRDVPIGNGEHIHTVVYHTDTDDIEQTTLVCMHGFATGAGIYYAALPALAERWPGKVMAIDSLGCGLSSRPRWKLGHGQSCRVADAEGFFLDGLERWRQAMKIDKMALMGHSLGGYLAVAYAEKYPERVERLVLVSPVGTPQPPPQLAEAHKSAPWPFRMVLGAWHDGWSPFTVAKLGLGGMMLGGYVRNRFCDASWVHKPALKEYLLGSWTDGANSAGGYAHATLLAPGGIGELAYAREPMGPTRIPGLRSGLRIQAIYGEFDWMDWRHMAAVRKQIAAAGKGGPTIEIAHVAEGNHNVQVDNPLGFVDAVMAHGADGKVFGRRYHVEDAAAASKEPPYI